MGIFNRKMETKQTRRRQESSKTEAGLIRNNSYNYKSPKKTQNKTENEIMDSKSRSKK